MRIFDRSRVEAYCGPTTLYHIIAGILPWVLFLGTVIAMVAAWGRIPEQIPMQTDIHGNITEWGAKSSLIWLGAIYFIINLTLLIVSFFPQSWNTSVRVSAFGIGKRNNVTNYRLTRDLLCDLRITMSILFSGVLLWAAFGSAGIFGTVFNIAVPLLILIPLARFLVRMYLFR